MDASATHTGRATATAAAAITDTAPTAGEPVTMRWPGVDSLLPQNGVRSSASTPILPGFPGTLRAAAPAHGHTAHAPMRLATLREESHDAHAPVASAATTAPVPSPPTRRRSTSNSSSGSGAATPPPAHAAHAAPAQPAAHVSTRRTRQDDLRRSQSQPSVRKPRKPYTITRQRQQWTPEEHERFVASLKLYERDWKRIAEYVGTKTVVQVRSHAQKHFNRIKKHKTGEYIPPPRRKRRPRKPSDAAARAAEAARVRDGVSAQVGQMGVGGAMRSLNVGAAAAAAPMGPIGGGIRAAAPELGSSPPSSYGGGGGGAESMFASMGALGSFDGALGGAAAWGLPPTSATAAATAAGSPLMGATSPGGGALEPMARALAHPHIQGGTQNHASPFDLLVGMSPQQLQQQQHAHQQAQQHMQNAHMHNAAIQQQAQQAQQQQLLHVHQLAGQDLAHLRVQLHATLNRVHAFFPGVNLPVVYSYIDAALSGAPMFDWYSKLGWKECRLVNYFLTNLAMFMQGVAIAPPQQQPQQPPPQQPHHRLQQQHQQHLAAALPMTTAAQAAAASAAAVAGMSPPQFPPMM